MQHTAYRPLERISSELGSSNRGIPTPSHLHAQVDGRNITRMRDSGDSNAPAGLSQHIYGDGNDNGKSPKPTSSNPRSDKERQPPLLPNLHLASHDSPSQIVSIALKSAVVSL